jgi:hypothetical protein
LVFVDPHPSPTLAVFTIGVKSNPVGSFSSIAGNERMRRRWMSLPRVRFAPVPELGRWARGDARREGERASSPQVKGRERSRSRPEGSGTPCLRAWFPRRSSGRRRSSSGAWPSPRR